MRIIELSGDIMIKTTNILLEELCQYASPNTKLLRMVRNGDLFPVIRGLYETSDSVPAHLLAGSIYGPSYISFEYAMSYYGLIPEAVYTVTCACFDKKKKKRYLTPFGTFTYRDVPSAAFPYGLEVKQEGDYWYRIASPEKALCDQLSCMSPVRNRKELETLLYDDFRIEQTELKKLDQKLISDLSSKYHSTNVQKLCGLLRRL